MEVKKEISNLQKEISNLQKENNELDSLIQYFETEEYVESASREKLGYKKPGEQIVVMTEEDSDLGYDMSLEEDMDSEGNFSNIKSWWDYFFNN